MIIFENTVEGRKWPSSSHSNLENDELLKTWRQAIPAGGRCSRTGTEVAGLYARRSSLYRKKHLKPIGKPVNVERICHRKDARRGGDGACREGVSYKVRKLIVESAVTCRDLWPSEP